jgi:hypothetical protein
MASVEGKCEKCGKRYGTYASEESAKRTISLRTCKKGGNCKADL